ncbi:MAG: protein kinase [Planctomycetales bacterium]|nr:protein kinase [Planctomycetales bacterium]NIN08433.1 protein kinase [Planctomycetales bacterium]NIN77562.1 protein kinase [Planctomycetales bacterium]NIO34732.1 protein kinase [Planctomycetales bacterium]NIO46535.1 protein kinase [Planctomycetales bacterium]
MTQQTTSSADRRSAALPHRAPDLPAVVGPWQLVEPLHSGHLSAAFLARPTGSDNPQCHYVVKLLATEFVHDAQACQAMRQEAYVGRKVSHPHLISVLDANIRTRPYFITMPRLPGQTLRQLLAAQRNLPPSTAFWIVRQVADALIALHDFGWLHGDVKPENILVAPDGHATLLDLGFARCIDQEGSAVDRQTMGTFNYIAPETVTSSLGSDGRSDIYSLGATLYEALSGRLPLTGRTLAEVASQHRQTRPTCIRSLLPQLPKAAASLVHRMLAKHPLRRPQTARELVHRLVALEIETFADCRVAG